MHSRSIQIALLLLVSSLRSLASEPGFETACGKSSAAALDDARLIVRYGLREAEARGDFDGYLEYRSLQMQLSYHDRALPNSPMLGWTRIRRAERMFNQTVIRKRLDTAKQNLREGMKTLLAKTKAGDASVRFLLLGDELDPLILFAIPDANGLHFVYYEPNIPCSYRAVKELFKKLGKNGVGEISDVGKSRQRYEARARQTVSQFEYDEKVDSPADYLYWSATGLFDNETVHFTLPGVFVPRR